MNLADQSVATGNWLFRRRGYLPLVLLAVVLPGIAALRYPLGSHADDIAWEIVCLLVSGCGLALRAYTVGHAPAHTSGRNTRSQVADVLNTTGAYSVVRNPLYLGNFLILLGVVAFSRDPWCVLVFSLVFWLYYERIISAEERFLEEQFWDEFRTWAARTPAFVPRLSRWRPPALSFSLRTVLKREYPGVLALVLAFAFQEVLGDYVARGVLMIDPLWATLLVVGVIASLVLRHLKKRTSFLEVEGR